MPRPIATGRVPEIEGDWNHPFDTAFQRHRGCLPDHPARRDHSWFDRAVKVPGIASRPLRVVAALLLLAGLSPGLVWRSPARTRIIERELYITALPVPAPAVVKPHLGAFTLEGIWQLTSRSVEFGGYSAMLVRPGGRLLLVSDSGFCIIISPPDIAGADPEWFSPRYKSRGIRGFHDFESATADSATGQVWMAEEGLNTIYRMTRPFRVDGEVAPKAMSDWGYNTGAEAMARLQNGRFVLLREAPKGWLEDRLHAAVQFSGDPVGHPDAMGFTFQAPAQFDPTDMAQMPDGRVLILMRRLTWPMPQRFAGRIVIADPADIAKGAVWRSQVVARLSSSLPIDNFEAMAIDQRKDGKLTVWLVSDDNHAAFQRTLIWKMVVDPARLPR